MSIWAYFYCTIAGKKYNCTVNNNADQKMLETVEPLQHATSPLFRGKFKHWVYCSLKCTGRLYIVHAKFNELYFLISPTNTGMWYYQMHSAYRKLQSTFCMHFTLEGFYSITWVSFTIVFHLSINFCTAAVFL